MSRQFRRILPSAVQLPQRVAAEVSAKPVWRTPRLVGVDLEPLHQQAARLVLEPALHAVLDLLLVGVRRQRQVQHARVGVEQQRAGR